MAPTNFNDSTVYIECCLEKKMFQNFMQESIHCIHFIQKQPIMTLEPGEGVIYSTKWSFSRPALFAATTDTGLLLLYDLTQNQPVPVYKLEAGGLMGNNARAPVLTCQFNQHQ